MQDFFIRYNPVHVFVTDSGSSPLIWWAQTKTKNIQTNKNIQTCANKIGKSNKQNNNKKLRSEKSFGEDNYKPKHLGDEVNV